MSSAFWYCNCRHPNTKVYYADECERLDMKIRDLESELKVAEFARDTLISALHQSQSAKLSEPK
jgi:hypothetical protein